MFRKWGHGHSLATGAIMGVLISHQASTLLVCVAVGVVLGRLWWYESRLAQTVAARVQGRRSRVIR